MFSEEQLGAIKSSLIHHIMILTGGPGTGKTTTLRGIINAYKKLEKKIALAAPTGRAAKRMTDVIGLEARTIHRLLEFVPSLGYFAVNADNPLQVDLLVIDEISMIDTFLMNSLLDAVPDETTVVFVGDADQLPSIGPGNILNDMISSKKIPTFRLTKIYRQEEASEIILAAHKINQGEILRIINREESDLFFIEETDPAEIPGTILSLCSSRIPSKYNFNPFSGIQVITPMYKGDAGADNLNELLQQGLNENPPLHKHAGKKYKIGDKVMQLRNNYEKFIFNGDIGIIEDIRNHTKIMAVNYAGKVVEYSFLELDEITLAYAITVHKSQGSEYPCIILPLTTGHYPLLQRNLLYTAITRASKLMIIIGSKQAMAMAIKNNRVVQRYTSLFKKFESFD
jgi:exodeoxyribonuclease V alpha subunit